MDCNPMDQRLKPDIPRRRSTSRVSSRSRHRECSIASRNSTVAPSQKQSRRFSLLFTIVLACTLFACATKPANAQTKPISSSASSPAKASSTTSTAPAVQTVNVEFKHKGGQTTSIGEVIIEAEDGGILLLTPEGQLWTLQPEDILARSPADKPMQALTSEEIYAKIKLQATDGFKVHKTSHFVIIYNTNDIYAQWVGEMYEGLFRKFHNFWKSKKIELEEPRFPLVAIVFNTKEAYLAYAEREIGETAAALIGYYNMQTNRMISFDMTGVAGLAVNSGRYSSMQMINQAFSQPGAERTLATNVHEAVHQLSFNTGLQVRLADNPLWFSEGMAMFFETPDTNSARGGATIGKINYHNLRLFANYLPKRPADSLTTLITDDSRLQNAKTANDAYSESWALTYYLLKTKSKQYVTYLESLRALPPLVSSTPRERVALFKRHFGDDLPKLDADFITFIRKLR